jgi:hypothetical protein
MSVFIGENMKQHIFVLSCLFAISCGTCGAKLPLETAPANLKEVALVIDELPTDAKGQWITVSGWIDKSVIHGVFIVGAPVEGFYQGFGGHMGIPSVPVVLRDDGRFVAPRVPLQDGENKIQIIPVAQGGAIFKTTEKIVKASDTKFVPATLVPSVDTAKPGEKIEFSAANGNGDVNSVWQFDFNSDGTFDAEGKTGSNKYEVGGGYTVSARTKVENRWVYATSFVAVEAESKVLKSTNDVINPTRLWVYDKTHSEQRKSPVGDWMRDTDILDERVIVAIDGPQVRIFDGELKPKLTLKGLNGPRDVIRDETHWYILDAGNRVVRFLSNGDLDSTFGTGGVLQATGAFSFGDAYDFGFSRETMELFGRLPDGSSFFCPFGEGTCITARSKEDEPRREDFPKGKIVQAYRGMVVFDNGAAYVMDWPIVRLRIGFGRRAIFGMPNPSTVGGEMVLDDSGVLHRFSSYNNHNASYKLSYKISAFDIDSFGQIWLSGPGTIELRNIKPLPLAMSDREWP